MFGEISSPVILEFHLVFLCFLRFFIFFKIFEFKFQNSLILEFGPVRFHQILKKSTNLLTLAEVVPALVVARAVKPKYV
jgi:hypothetical protein